MNLHGRILNRNWVWFWMWQNEWKKS